MLYESACREAKIISSRSLPGPLSRRDWQKTLPQRRKQWLEMLGLQPLPEKTPLKTTFTGTLERKGYIVERLHFQSLPGVYVPGNLYRPAAISRPLPAILYLCGHSSQGKACDRYQAHARWFARHGYIALALDTIEIGEGTGDHHGTYSHDRWDWHSRGYTPAGIEVWNAMRALDYLETRPEVDAKRFGVTGISGGGGISWFLAGADERIKCAAPCCQSGSIAQHVVDRTVDGHCDCAFWINYYQWCWPDIGALIAPRPLLVAAATDDMLWRPYAYRDVMRRIRRQFAELGAGGNVNLVEDNAPHSYTPKLRKAIFAWFNRHLKNEPGPVRDDLSAYVEPEKNLNVFRGKRPENDRTGKVANLLVHRAGIYEPANNKQWRSHQRKTIAAIRTLSFRNIKPPAAEFTYRNFNVAKQVGRGVPALSEAEGPAEPSESWMPRAYSAGVSLLATKAGRGIPTLTEERDDGSSGAVAARSYIFQSGDGLHLRVRMNMPVGIKSAFSIVHAAPEELKSTAFFKARPGFKWHFATACVEVRNAGATSAGPGYSWTLRRSYPLLGHTLPERQISDLLDGMAILRRKLQVGKIILFGEGRAAVLAIYAAVLDGKVAEIILKDPPDSHARPETPEIPGILRFGDLPQNLALLHPLPITFIGKIPRAYAWAEKLYRRLGPRGLIRQFASLQDWRPLH